MGLDHKPIIDLFNCLPMIKELSFKQLACKKDCENLLENRKRKHDSIKIRVDVRTLDVENDPLSYKYKTTGGKIIGVGSNVIWELSKNISKTYAIEVCVNDGMGCKKNINIASAHIYVVDY